MARFLEELPFMDYAEKETRLPRIYLTIFHDASKLHVLPVPMARMSMCGMIEIEVLIETVAAIPRAAMRSSHPSCCLSAAQCLLLLLKL